ncbi:MAG: hypothetical protein WAM13_11920 [Candidatus Sulfotelmatobacter sp.]|jgi:hypothetical protein
MTEFTDKIALVNSAQHLYLRKLSEPRDNSLRIVVQEAISNRAKAAPLEIPGSPGKFFDGQAWPIESTDSCRTFVLHWHRYVAYLVTEEGVGSCGKRDDEVFTGRLVRLYTKSHMLDHIARDTGGHFEDLQHYKVMCLNHFIDVVSTKLPTVEIIEGGPELREPTAVM